MKKIEMGKKYRTRAGHAVRILCVDRDDKDYPVVGLPKFEIGGEGLIPFTAEGSYEAGKHSPFDLVEVPPYADIPIDTPGWARGADGHWHRRHFAGVGSDGLPKCWVEGKTKHTSYSCLSYFHEFTTTKPEGVE